jgi:NIMA (never in mitosis gene a)-related kinase
MKKINSTEDDIQNEVDILSNINSEYIVKYYNSFIKDGNLSIIMEYCDNSDLRKIINEHKSNNNQLIDQAVIISIIFQICLGLKVIHDNRIIHRDLKPENIFINEDYKIKIGDFGISKKLKASSEYAYTSDKGTFNYMAPEMLINSKYTNKVDIWALGCILYELCTLNYCFDNIIYIIENKNTKKINLKYYNSKLQNLIDILLKTENERPNILIMFYLYLLN